MSAYSTTKKAFLRKSLHNEKRPLNSSDCTGVLIVGTE